MTRTPRWRRLLSTAIAVSASALMLTSVASAAAHPDDRSADPAADRTPTRSQIENDPALGNHAMGSQIAKHEGTRGQISSEQARRLEPRGLGAGGVEAKATVPGVDVSSHQGSVNWQGLWDDGYRFAYVKATEGTYYKNEYFSQQYNGSFDVGMIRGSYHFARPDKTSGAVQANYFVDNGGGWSGDGKTLPGALDIEYNPYGPTCYGLTKTQMGKWIRDFHDTYHSRTGRWPAIYTTTNWWNQCVGSTQSFGDTAPLWLARYASSPGPLPPGWDYHTIWQHSSDPIDQNLFNGSLDQLKALADG